MFRVSLILIGIVAMHVVVLAALLKAPGMQRAQSKPLDPVTVAVLPQAQPVPAAVAPRPERPASARLPVPKPVTPTITRQEATFPVTPKEAPAQIPDADTGNATQAGADVTGASPAPTDIAQTSTSQSTDETPAVPSPSMPTGAPPSTLEDTVMGLGVVSRNLDSRELRYVGYLNGNAVATGVYRLERKDDRYRSSFQVSATGVTAWLWRGVRLEEVEGRLGTTGLAPERIRQRQGERPARERDVSPNSLDFVSLIFQLATIGRNFPERMVPGFQGTLRLQKTSRVDVVRVEVQAGESLMIDGAPRHSIVVSLSDSTPLSQNTEKQTIWFVPDMEWAPVRLSVPTGKYQVEFRMDNLAAPAQPQREAP